MRASAGTTRGGALPPPARRPPLRYLRLPRCSARSFAVVCGKCLPPACPLSWRWRGDTEPRNGPTAAAAMDRSRKPVWADSRARGFESLPLRSCDERDIRLLMRQDVLKGVARRGPIPTARVPPPDQVAPTPSSGSDRWLEARRARRHLWPCIGAASTSFACQTRLAAVLPIHHRGGGGDRRHRKSRPRVMAMRDLRRDVDGYCQRLVIVCDSTWRWAPAFLGTEVEAALSSRRATSARVLLFRSPQSRFRFA